MKTNYVLIYENMNLKKCNEEIYAENFTDAYKKARMFCNKTKSIILGIIEKTELNNI